MSARSFHLTQIGRGDFLLEPTRGIDVAHPGELIEDILLRLQHGKPVRLYYDLAELPLIDPVYYNWLNALARACQTLNVTLICIHMQPTAAFGLTSFIDRTPTFQTARDVSSLKISAAHQLAIDR